MTICTPVTPDGAFAIWFYREFGYTPDAEADAATRAAFEAGRRYERDEGTRKA
jgi:hypothetical protein